jgi:hypothetical protein
MEAAMASSVVFGGIDEDGGGNDFHQLDVMFQR